jgi:predicted AlkP superfamily pyrophosphatase or phosphodiesterase
MIRTLADKALFILWLALGCLPAAHAGDETNAQRLLLAKRPRLVVVISIDQFRADYLQRFADLYLPPKLEDGKPGGFRYLMSAGSTFLDARYRYVPTFTCVGHAAMLSGASPYKSGIVSNRWWDKATQLEVYCADDASQRVVGAAEGSKAKPMGSRMLRVTTVGDELKLATGGAAKVVSLALKDRAAIMMGGHTQDVSIWFDETGGRWISSTAFARDGKLPAWVEALNTEAIPNRSLGATWSPSVPPAALARAIAPELKPDQARGFGTGFPHHIGAEPTSANYSLFTLLPAANAFVFETAKRAVIAEKLGQRDVPDLLAINLSTNDYVGHVFGPDSPEVLDLSVQTDRQVAGFLQFLASTIPGGLREVIVVLTSDHGVAPIPEELQERGIPSGRIGVTDLLETADRALIGAFGGGPWTIKSAGAFVDPNLYLSASAIEQALKSGKAQSRSQIEDTAAQALTSLPGVYAAYTRSQIEKGQVPDTAIGRGVVLGFHPKVSGDVVVVAAPGWYPGIGNANTSHGSPYSYDTNVPLLIAGPGIRAGMWVDPVSPADIAPTLSMLLGIAAPSGSDGMILKAALR